jgi:hypothetical protein
MELARVGGVLRRFCVNREELKMKNIVIFRLSEDDSTWIADLDAGTVERADDFDMDTEDTGVPQAQGVDVAIAAKARPDAASHFLYPSHGPQLEGVASAHAAKARPDAASHFLYPSHGPQLEGVASAKAAKVRPDAASHFLYPSH